MIRSRQRFGRGFWVIWGIFLMVWLPIEDSSFAGPLFLGYSLAVLISSIWNPKSLSQRILAGASFAFIGTISALFLMVFKTGIHGHGFPDFPLNDFAWLAKSIPLTTVLGGIIGSLMFFRASVKP